MKKKSESQQTPSSAEPIGIVISRGRDVDTAPLFSAYVWGPAPEEKAKEKAHAA